MVIRRRGGVITVIVRVKGWRRRPARARRVVREEEGGTESVAHELPASFDGEAADEETIVIGVVHDVVQRLEDDGVRAQLRALRGWDWFVDVVADGQ